MIYHLVSSRHLLMPKLKLSTRSGKRPFYDNSMASQLKDKRATSIEVLFQSKFVFYPMVRYACENTGVVRL